MKVSNKNLVTAVPDIPIYHQIPWKWTVLTHQGQQHKPCEITVLKKLHFFVQAQMTLGKKQKGPKKKAGLKTPYNRK